jgi:hypothetical protein
VGRETPTSRPRRSGGRTAPVVAQGIRGIAKGAKMAYLGEEEQRRRIRGIVLAKTGVDCPDLVIHEVSEGMGPARVNYTCKEGEPSRELRLSEEDAVYVGLDRSGWRQPPETGG